MSFFAAAGRLGLAISLTLSAAACAGTETRIAIDPSVSYQTIIGWEATANLGIQANTPERRAVDAPLLDRIVGDVGINRLRLEVRSGVENASGGWLRLKTGDITYEAWRRLRYATVNDNDDPKVIRADGFDFAELDNDIETAVLPMRRRLEASGERLFVNLCYVSFIDKIPQEGAYVHADPEEYAEFILATYQHMKAKYGFTPDALEVVLEPDNKNPFWADGATMGRAMAATARRLTAAGFKPNFIAPSLLDMSKVPAYFDRMAGVPGALDHLSELSYHRYVGASPQALAEIRARAEAHHAQPAMLEYWFGRADYGVLHEDLKQGMAAAWQGRALDSFYKRTAASGSGLGSIEPDIAFNRLYFRYIRSGARRIGATSSDEADFDPLAFRNVAGDFVLVVKARHGGDVVVTGLPKADYRAVYATKTSDRAGPISLDYRSDGTVRAGIPAGGVLTLYAAGGYR